jgi:glutamate synthase (NADPH/NADH) small chain
LVQRGYDVTVYDNREKPGGLNTFGVADYKMDHATALKEVEWVEGLGVKIVRNTTVGKDLPVEKLLADNDALFLGVGLGAIPNLGIPGEDLDGVLDALDFIEALKITPKAEQSLAGRTVAVLGGGNTAIDGVTQSIRLGADQVYLVYRREEDAMPAYEHEIELARLDGVDFIFSSSPVSIGGDNDGKVDTLRCIMTRTTTEDARGPLEIVADSEFDLSVDIILRATGQEKRTEFLSTVDSLNVDKKGCVVVDENGRTSNEKIWAGGDCVNGGKEVVNAVAAGRDAALDIDRVLARLGA